MLDDARLLVKGDEIPQADVLQNEAQLARDRGLRLAAEQTVVEVRSALAIAMGQPLADVTQLASPLDDFPDLQPDDVMRLPALPPPAGRFDLLAVKAGISVQRARLSSAVLQLEQQRRQVALQAQVFANERKKYRLGLATVLDLLTVEARLTSDELAVIDARRRLAQALVGYRFETGTLLGDDGDSRHVDLQSLTTLPEPR